MINYQSSVYPIVWLFFVIFVFIGTFIFINILLTLVTIRFLQTNMIINNKVVKKAGLHKLWKLSICQDLNLMEKRIYFKDMVSRQVSTGIQKKLKSCLTSLESRIKKLFKIIYELLMKILIVVSKSRRSHTHGNKISDLNLKFLEEK